MYIASALLGLVLSIAFTGWSFRLLRLRRELRDLGHETTPQIDRAAKQVGGVASVAAIVSIFACGILLYSNPQTQVQTYFLFAFFGAAQWLIMLSRWDKVDLPPFTFFTCEAAARLTPVAVLAVLLWVVSIPLTSFPMGMQLLYVAVSSYLVIGAASAIRERIVHAGAFDAAETQSRKMGLQKAAMRFAMGYGAMLSFCGALYWAIEVGIVPRWNDIWNLVGFAAYFFVDVYMPIVASSAYTPPEKPKRKAIPAA